MSEQSMSEQKHLEQVAQDLDLSQIQDYPLHFAQTVAWGDMDAFGHVNNVMYYRYFESARINYFEQFKLFAHDLITVIAKSDCRYLSPVFYPDQLIVATRVEQLGNTSMTMRYTLFSQSQNKVVADGEAVIVCLDAKTQVKKVIPDAFKQQVIAFEAQAGHIF